MNEWKEDTLFKERKTRYTVLMNERRTQFIKRGEQDEIQER